MTPTRPPCPLRSAARDDAVLVCEHDGLHPVAQVQFMRMCATCVFTVVSETKASLAISAFERPSLAL